MFFLFGKKQKSKRRHSKKPPASLLKMCKKYKVKTMKRVGNKKVYKRSSVLKKQCKVKARLMKKQKHKAKPSNRRTRRSGFGNTVMGYQFENPLNYGFNQPVKQYPQVLSQSNSVVNKQMNNLRPDSMKLSSSDLPVYGTYRKFFGQDVPTQLPPQWNFMGQNGGSSVAVGSPFYKYTSPIASAFGKKMHRYRKSSRSACSSLRKKSCKLPMCTYVKGRGCRRSTKAPSHVMSGDDDLGAYADAAGISFFGKKMCRYNVAGKKKRYNVAGSSCNRLKKRVCRSNPNCSYTKRGCRRRSKTLVYEGPSLAFGARKYNVTGSPCNRLRKRICQSTPNCSYTKRGCRRRGKTLKGVVYEGPSLAFGLRKF